MTYFFVFFKYHIQKIVPITIARIDIPFSLFEVKA